MPAVLLLEGHACIGTDHGAVLCVPSESLDEAAAFELRQGGSGLSKVGAAAAGGVWGVLARVEW